MTFCRKTIWMLVAVTVLLPAGCASQRGRTASRQEVNTAQLLAAARQYEKEGNLQSAAGIYQHVLRFHPGNEEAREGLALVQQGKLRVNYDPQQLLASSNPAVQQNPQAREQLAKVRKAQREQVDERMAELIAQAAKNPTRIEVDPTPARAIVASTSDASVQPGPAPAKLQPQPKAAEAAPPQSIAAAPSEAEPKPQPPAPIAQVAAVAEKPQAAEVETTDFSRPQTPAENNEVCEQAEEAVPADWLDAGWKGHSLTDKCEDASAAVLTQVRKLESSADADRKEGLTRLALMGPEAISALPAVRRLLNDQNQLVSAHAAWAVWEIEGDAQTALEVLEQGLTSKSTHVVQFAAYTLGNLGEFARPTVPALTMLLSDDESYVRLHAAEALARVGDSAQATGAMDTLLLLLKDSDAAVRMLAATALGETKLAETELAIAALTAALDDEDANVRSAAALSLGAFGASAEVAVTRLEQLLDAEQSAVSEAATTALACIQR